MTTKEEVERQARFVVFIEWNPMDKAECETAGRILNGVYGAFRKLEIEHDSEGGFSERHQSYEYDAMVDSNDISKCKRALREIIKKQVGSKAMFMPKVYAIIKRRQYFDPCEAIDPTTGAWVTKTISDRAKVTYYDRKKSRSKEK